MDFGQQIEKADWISVREWRKKKISLETLNGG